MASVRVSCRPPTWSGVPSSRAIRAVSFVPGSPERAYPHVLRERQSARKAFRFSSKPMTWPRRLSLAGTVGSTTPSNDSARMCRGSGMRKQRHAEIAGAGTAGLIAATLLARAGWSVRVHERADVIREIGAGIFLHNNGLLVLEETGLMDELAPRGTR